MGRGGCACQPAPPGGSGLGGGRAHVVVVVRAGSSTQNLIVALQEGMQAALKSLELLEHLDVLRRGRMAVGNPKRLSSVSHLSGQGHLSLLASRNPGPSPSWTSRACPLAPPTGRWGEDELLPPCPLHRLHLQGQDAGPIRRRGLCEPRESLIGKQHLVLLAPGRTVQLSCPVLTSFTYSRAPP